MKLWHTLSTSLTFLSGAECLNGVIADHTNYNGSKGTLPGPKQHACCYFDSKWDGGENITIKVEEKNSGSLFITHPHPLNHTSSVLIDCMALGLGKSEHECKRCKEYAVCEYCQCIAESGQRDNICCSLNPLTSGGIDNSSGVEWPYCTTEKLVYSPDTNTMSMCPFNYDMYKFGQTGGARSIVAFGSLVACIIFSIVL